MKQLNRYFLLIITAFIANVSSAQKTYTNPLLPSGADPWVISQNGYYYYTNTTGRNITLWKTKNITDLKSAEKKVIWTPPRNRCLFKRNMGAGNTLFTRQVVCLLCSRQW